MTITPTREQFRELAKASNLIPLIVDLVADAETPISTFAKIDDGGPCFLFESAETSEESGRFSFVGFDPLMVLKSDGTEKDPLGALQNAMALFQIRRATGHLAFSCRRRGLHRLRHRAVFRTGRAYSFAPRSQIARDVIHDPADPDNFRPSLSQIADCRECAHRRSDDPIEQAYERAEGGFGKGDGSAGAADQLATDQLGENRSASRGRK